MNIASKASVYRPTWIKEDVSAEWQADQFLHAYYYNELMDGAKHIYEDSHANNKGDPAKALEAGLKW